MGMVSFILCDIARELGVVGGGRRAGRADPAGRRRRAGLGRADPRAARDLQRRSAPHAPAAGRRRPTRAGPRRSAAMPIDGVTVKVNLRLSELPELHGAARARPAAPHRAGQHAALQGRMARPPPAGQRGRAAAADLERALPADGVRPERGAGRGAHAERLRPVRAHPVPRGRLGHAAGRGGAGGGGVDRPLLQQPPRGDHRRWRCWARPTSSGGSGSPGGHIFQGEILPQYMWDRRLRARTPMPGVLLCGAGTHPGGSVIGINGRNAAMEVLKDGRQAEKKKAGWW